MNTPQKGLKYGHSLLFSSWTWCSVRVNFDPCLIVPIPCVQEITPSVIAEATKVFVNGTWVGVHRDPDKLVKTLRQLRRKVSSEGGLCNSLSILLSFFPRFAF